MSKIDKLSILGVRSFDNKSPETIQFYAPLTLIVGYNGSGKTTIIEALKYATTGELPPNSGKSGAWIHDPKLAGEKEVLAQVKLAFNAASGTSMVATRSLQLTVKKNTRSQKTLEGNLCIKKRGERTVLSSRIAELDQMMPQYLGVSKAILDNVIFCHQDESLWPMSEPSVLKKKFDEIFEALKYTKAVDNIKLLRKKQNEELAKLKLIEDRAKDDKEKGRRTQKRLTELSNEIEAQRAEIHVIGKQKAEAENELKTAYEHVKMFSSIVTNLKGKRFEADTKEDSVRDLQAHMVHMEDSDRELEVMRDSYQERVDVYDRDLDMQKQQYHGLEAQIEQTRNTLGQKQSDLGRLQAKKDQHEQQLARRQDRVKSLARTHNIRGYDHDLDSDQVQSFVQRIGKMVREQAATVDRVRRETQDEVNGVQTKLNSFHTRKDNLKIDKEKAKAQKVINDSKIANLRKDLIKLDVDEGQIAALDTSLEELITKRGIAHEGSNRTNWEDQLAAAISQEQSIDRLVTELESQRDEAAIKAHETAKLDLVKGNLKKAQRSLEAHRGAHSERLSAILGNVWQDSNLEQVYQAVLQDKLADLKEAEGQRNGIARDLEQAENNLNALRNEHVQKRAMKQELEKTIRTALDDDEPSEFPDTLRTLEQNRDTLAKDSGIAANLGNFYTKCMGTAESNNACWLCQRTFKADKDISSFKKRLEKLLSDTAQEAIKQELKEMDAELTKVKAASGSYEHWRRLEDVEVPKAESEIKQLQPRREELLNKVEQADRAVEECATAKDEIDSIAKTVRTIVDNIAEIARLESDLESITQKHSQSGNMRGLEELREELGTAQERLRAARLTVDRVKDERTRVKDELSRLELELEQTSNKRQGLAYQLERRRGFDGQIRELSEWNEGLRESLISFDTEIEIAVNQIAQWQSKLDETTERCNQKVESLQKELNSIKDTERQLQQDSRDIDEFNDSGGIALLKQCEKEMKHLQSEQKDIESEQRQLASEINELNKKKENHDKIWRQINDNLRYRHNMRALEALRAEIADLEEQNAEADEQNWSREGDEWQMKLNELSAKQASTMGEMKTKDVTLQQLIDDWNTDYKDAAYKYKEAHIKVEATKAAVEDLGRYGGALDKAIMKYHSLKMEEINAIIEELWRRTYQGTDVDTVLIRSDSDNTKGNKSYNYRVCMIKQDAEMDMRGRCSAGQKVLASIIIRLALAECFGTNCGLIALDEPTTNLDRENIRALADSLHSIIQARQAQKNFQLIVITHDEEFLRDMHCGDFCDKYYRVSRNEKQKSQIERQSIQEVL